LVLSQIQRSWERKDYKEFFLCSTAGPLWYQKQSFLQTNFFPKKNVFGKKVGKEFVEGKQKTR